MALWTDFYNDVLPEVPGCSTPMAEHEIKNAAIDFLIRTEILRKTITGVDHPGGASPIDLTSLVASTEQVVSVLGVWINDTSLNVVSAEDIQKKIPDWMTITGTPIWAVQEESNLWLVPSPATAQTDTIKVRVSYAPKRNAGGIPDTIFEAYHEDIALGAKGRLLAKAKKPWTDQALAAQYLQMFSRAIDAVAVMAWRGGRKSKIRVPTQVQ